MSIALVMPSSHLILGHLLFLLPSVFPSVRDFSNELAIHIRWPKYWSFSFSISPSSERSGLISLKIDWFDLLAFQGTFRSLLQYYLEGINSLAFCLLHGPALTTVCDHWEDHSLDYMDLCGKIMFLLFSTLSRFVIAFLPRSNHLLISWLQSQSAVIFKPQKKKSVTTSTFSPFYLPWRNGAWCHDLSFFNIQF